MLLKKGGKDTSFWTKRKTQSYIVQEKLTIDGQNKDRQLVFEESRNIYIYIFIYGYIIVSGSFDSTQIQSVHPTQLNRLGRFYEFNRINTQGGNEHAPSVALSLAAVAMAGLPTAVDCFG